MTVTVLYIFFRKRDSLSLQLLLMSLAFSLMFIGVITTIAKSGGYNDASIRFLFFDKRIQQYLQQSPVTLSRIGYMVALGRTLFPYFMFLLAVESTMIPWIRRHQRLMQIAAAVPTVLLLIYYYPQVFRWLVHDRFYLLINMIYLARIWIIAMVAVSLLLFSIEFFSISMKHCRRDFGKMALGVVGITMLYGLYAIQDPAQIYNMFISEFISIHSLTYLSRTLTHYGYLSALVFVLFFLIIGPMGMISYTQINYLEEQRDRSLQRKFSSRSLGVSVFAHSMKNQLIAARILDRRMLRAADQADWGELQTVLTRQAALHEEMLGALNRFYKNLRSAAPLLAPVRAADILQTVEQSVQVLYSEPRNLVVRADAEAVLLADCTRLSDALVQLVRNAFEADADEVLLTFQRERLYYVFCVRDNGKGMERRTLRGIFDPFYSTKSSSTNWGLGLYFARNTVRGHYGKIKVESRPGKGSAFYLMLPKYLEKRKP